MTRPTSKTSKFCLAVAAAVLVAAGLTTAIGVASATNDSSGAAGPQVGAVVTCRHVDRLPTQEIATAKLFIEYNSSDDDIGVHGAFDDHGWKRLCVFDPTGAQVLAVNPLGQLRDLTMAGIFFESREPPGNEFSFADLTIAFPDGQYAVRGTTFEGVQLAGSAMFTHDVPAAPVITAPPVVDDAELAGDATVPAAGLAVTWDDVTQTTDGRPVTITGYEVIITKEVDDDPNGFSRPTYDVHLPASANSLSVPAEFLEPGTVYEIEVLALEVSGNQTITVGFFMTL